ncbi:MAG: TolC family protein, partial [Myxococcales bacterium]|nr:TolC family protein [Myxococcales bacterium]
VALARAQRPELQEASAKLAAGAAAVRLARNRVAPRLDFELFGSKDLGDAPTEEERDRLARPQLEGGVLFKIPIPLRTDRGQRRNAEAKQAALEADVRWLRDQLQAEVGDVLARLRAAREQIELTEAAVRVSQAVAQGERERFELGVSTLLHVNLREEAAADAEAAHTVAEAELAVTSVLFDVVRGFDPSASRVGDG